MGKRSNPRAKYLLHAGARPQTPIGYTARYKVTRNLQAYTSQCGRVITSEIIFAMTELQAFWP